jgi:hypothetical protein
VPIARRIIFHMCILSPPDPMPACSQPQSGE